MSEQPRRRVTSRIPVFNSVPTQRFLSIGEGAHLDSLAAPEYVDVREIHIVRLVAAFESNPCVHKHDDAVSCRNETLGITAALCPDSPIAICRVTSEKNQEELDGESVPLLCGQCAVPPKPPASPAKRHYLEEWDE